jgi:hypothetical protein
MDHAMDCQTCNDLLLDLAYGELDEVRAAAVRKHMDSCAECRDAFARVGRGRSLASHLTREEAPPVSHALRAALEAQAARFAEATAAAAGASSVVPAGAGGDPSRDSNIVPFAPRDGRVSRWFERIGELAMRRQVAMAAVFLIMIGVGLIFYQSHPRPTDAQDDRLPDVVPAVEITPSNGAQAGTGRLPAAAYQTSRDRDERMRNLPSNNSPSRQEGTASRERSQANARAAGTTGTDDSWDTEAVARAAEAQRVEAEAQAALQSGAVAAQQSEGAQPPIPQAQPAAPNAQAAQAIRQLDAVQPARSAAMPPAQVAMQPQQMAPSAGRSGAASAIAPSNNIAANDTIARLQGELAAATDEAMRSRIRAQLIAEYERRGMYAEANTLRAQSAEPANAVSNSIANSAGTTNVATGGARAQATAPAAASPNVEAPGSAPSVTRTTTMHRSTIRRAAPRRSTPSDSFTDMAY